MIYLASPFSKNPALRVAQHRAACDAAAALLKAGLIAYSPVAHNYGMMSDLPDSWDFWERITRAHLARASEVAVLAIDGWQDDSSVQATIAIARELGLPVRFLSVTGPRTGAGPEN